MENLNKVDPSVNIFFDGKDREIKLSFGTLKRYQKISGKNPFKAEWFSEFSPEDISQLILAALIKEMPDLTIEIVDDKLEAVPATELVSKITSILSYGSPEPDKNQKEIAEENLKKNG